MALLHFTYEETKARIRKLSALAQVTALMESGIKACSDPETWGPPTLTLCPHILDGAFPEGHSTNRLHKVFDPAV